MNLYNQWYGVETVALRTALFNEGLSCSTCFEIKCADDPQWCHNRSQSILITVTNFYPPCRKPLGRPRHVMFIKITKYRAGIASVNYHRCGAGSRVGSDENFTGEECLNKTERNYDECVTEITRVVADRVDVLSIPLGDRQDGHGTHTAMMVAGAPIAGANLLGYATGTSYGITSRVRVAAYMVCWTGGCFSLDILATIDRAVADGIDMLSISLGGGGSSYYWGSLSIGAFSSMEMGVFVACSAGSEERRPGSDQSNECLPRIRSFLRDEGKMKGVSMSSKFISSLLSFVVALTLAPLRLLRYLFHLGIHKSDTDTTNLSASILSIRAAFNPI